jgi:hypothetical protein
VQLLAGNDSAAKKSWDKMDTLKPMTNVYTSGLPVLESLSNTLPNPEAFQRAAERFRAGPPIG